LDREVISDSKWLQFMIGQIVDNSIKYGEKGSLVLEIYSTAGENAVQLHIKDNGIGIKSTEIDRVFDKGFTGKNGRGGANSTGIGLYLCRNLCKKLEHNITLTSKEGEGTTVTIVFPISSMTEVAAKAEQ
ncbi:MAG: sensor histidine kinase, partial [Lachnospiraceae bacterium]|nr:sensor histidine kinase [Lachnospiraceae bacterium]